MSNIDYNEDCEYYIPTAEDDLYGLRRIFEGVPEDKLLNVFTAKQIKDMKSKLNNPLSFNEPDLNGWTAFDYDEPVEFYSPPSIRQTFIQRNEEERKKRLAFYPANIVRLYGQNIKVRMV